MGVQIFLFSCLMLCASLVAQMVKNLPTTRETWVPPPGQEDPLEKGMATHCSILAWIIPWTEQSGGLYRSWGYRESDTTEQLTHKQCFMFSAGDMEMIKHVLCPPRHLPTPSTKAGSYCLSEGKSRACSHFPPSLPFLQLQLSASFPISLHCCLKLRPLSQLAKVQKCKPTTHDLQPTTNPAGPLPPGPERSPLPPANVTVLPDRKEAHAHP